MVKEREDKNKKKYPGYKFDVNGKIIFPNKIKDDAPDKEWINSEKDPLHSDIVNRIINIIKNTFNDELKVKEGHDMATLFTEKRLITNRLKALYWVDFKEIEHTNGKYGIRIHIQKTKPYYGRAFDDPKGRLDISISFKGSGYPCFVISNKDDMDKYFERIIKMTYNLLVKEEIEKIKDEWRKKKAKQNE